MKTLQLIVIASVWASQMPLVAVAEDLVSGEYSVTQSWSQEKEFPRPYYVHVPDVASQEKLPVFIFLHGNGHVMVIP